MKHDIFSKVAIYIWQAYTFAIFKKSFILKPV